MRATPVLVTVAILLSAGIAACGGKGEGPAGPRGVRLTVAPRTVTLTAIGDSALFAATLHDERGYLVAGQPVEWSVLDAPLGIRPGGYAIALATGTARIVARSGAYADTATVTVQQVTATLSVTPSSATVAPGAEWTFSAAAADANGAPIAATQLTWQSSDPGVVAVDGAGRARALVEGRATVTVRAPGGRSVDVPVLVATPTGGDVKWASISVGAGLACGVTREGAGYCWGFGGGRLGTSLPDEQCRQSATSTTTFPCSLAPAPVAGGLTWTMISAGEQNACGVTTAGALYCWGWDRLLESTGPQPCGAVRCSFVPVRVGGALTFSAVSVSREHACAIASSARVYCWGRSTEGELAASGSFATPVDSRSYTEISVGTFFSCALSTDGRAYCWGSNEYYALGSDASTGDCYYANVTRCTATPTPVATTLPLRGLAAGLDGHDSHACALADAVAYCWGSDRKGQLGVEPTALPQCSDVQAREFFRCATAPVAVATDLRFASLSGGDARTCGITTSGAAYCWGKDVGLGDGVRGSSGSFRAAPVAVAGGINFMAIDAGQDASCGVATDGAAYCWASDFISATIVTGSVESPAFVPRRVASPR